MIRNASILVLFFLLGCGTSKKNTQLQLLPDWVQKKPVSESYYIGIGSALKNGSADDYQGQAKKNALADLSSEITVTIASRSVLHQFESLLGYSEEFMATTKTESNENLEGYELMQTFENETHFYIWYRLSKAGFRQIKEQRKQASVTKGVDFYDKAQIARSNNQYYEAIVNYIKGLEAIKPYFSESLEINYQEKNIFLGNELFTGLLSVVGDIKIVPNKTEIAVKNGAPVTAQELGFRCLNGKNQPLSGIPVVFSLQQRPLPDNTAESNSEGAMSYSLHQVSSLKEIEFFVATVDLVNKASQITPDPVFRKMLRKIDPPKGQIALRIFNPSFFVITNEKNLDKNLEPKIMDAKLKNMLAQQGFPVVLKMELADYRLELQANTSELKKEGRIHYAGLQGEVKVFNAQEQLVFIKSFENIRGTQLGYPEAGLDAYQNLSDYLSKNLTPKLKELVQ
jgi:hypothetical protein